MWWDGATTFKETFTAEDSMTPAMDFQDSMDDIELEPGSDDRAVAAYDMMTTDDENDSGDDSQTSQPLPVHGRTIVARSAATCQADTMATPHVGRRAPEPAEYGKHRSYPYVTNHPRFRPRRTQSSSRQSP